MPKRAFNEPGSQGKAQFTAFGFGAGNVYRALYKLEREGCSQMNWSEHKQTTQDLRLQINDMFTSAKYPIITNRLGWEGLTH